jgi:hypothetical protein
MALAEGTRVGRYWGDYEGDLPATTNARIRSAHATPMRRVSGRAGAKRPYRRVLRGLSR